MGLRLIGKAEGVDEVVQLKMYQVDPKVTVDIMSTDGFYNKLIKYTDYIKKISYDHVGEDGVVNYGRLYIDWLLTELRDMTAKGYTFDFVAR